MAETLENLLAGVGDILLNLRLEAGLTQRQAAKLIGTTQAEVTYIEKNQKADMKVSTLLKIANAFDQDLWIFICPPEGNTNDQHGDGVQLALAPDPDGV